jgi:hypothetical protein
MSAWRRGDAEPGYIYTMGRRLCVAGNQHNRTCRGKFSYRPTNPQNLPYCIYSSCHSEIMHYDKED